MTFRNKEAELLNLIQTRGLIRTSEAEDEGFARIHLSRLAEKGKIIRVSRGVYEPAEPQHVSEHHSLAEVACAIPGAVVCLLSALVYHGIGTQMPDRVWIAIAHGSRHPKISHPPIRVVKLSPHYLESGHATHHVDGVEVRITTPARTVVDCFRFRNEVGLDVAIEALRDGLQQKLFTPNEIAEEAKTRRIWSVLRPYLEATL
ncbi:MAG: type IV toxin-antitoxin system AbiEi family antitoxin domain-containing protein [Verrucomicrobiota bacterium]